MPNVELSDGKKKPMSIDTKKPNESGQSPFAEVTGSALHDAQKEAIFWRRAFIAGTFCMVWNHWWLCVAQYVFTMLLFWLWDGFEPNRRY